MDLIFEAMATALPDLLSQISSGEFFSHFDAAIDQMTGPDGLKNLLYLGYLYAVINAA